MLVVDKDKCDVSFLYPPIGQMMNVAGVIQPPPIVSVSSSSSLSVSTTAKGYKLQEIPLRPFRTE